MPVITHIARQIFTYPFVIKVWEKVTEREGRQMLTRLLAYSKNYSKPT